MSRVLHRWSLRANLTGAPDQRLGWRHPFYQVLRSLLKLTAIWTNGFRHWGWWQALEDPFAGWMVWVKSSDPRKELRLSNRWYILGWSRIYKRSSTSTWSSKFIGHRTLNFALRMNDENGRKTVITWFPRVHGVTERRGDFMIVDCWENDWGTVGCQCGPVCLWCGGIPRTETRWGSVWRQSSGSEEWVGPSRNLQR